MKKVIAVSNHKGGVGKTTSTLNIGAGIALKGIKVLLIDIDPQSNLTQCLGITDVEKSIYGALRGDHDLPIIKINENLDVVPSTCLLYTSPSPRDRTRSRMPSSA